jgi:hypothetical protein
MSISIEALLRGDHLPLPPEPETMTEAEADVYFERIAIMVESGIPERTALALARGEIMQERRRTTVELCEVGDGRFF